MSQVDRLVRQRASALARVAALEAEMADVVESATSTNGDDEHDPEGATVGFERAQLAALLSGAREHVADIDRALSRLSEGSYGFCVDCGDPIGPDRLEALPTAQRCVSCAVQAARRR
jgi:RNA polymerase-binding transcription factor DksA